MTAGIPEREPVSLLERLVRHGGRPALVDDQGAWTYEDLLRHADGLAASLLMSRASLHHERVALLAGPGRPYVAGLLSIWRAGGVAVPLSPLQPETEWHDLLADSGAGLAVVDPESGSRFAPVARSRGVRVLTTDADTTPRMAPVPALQGAALILYTSGTTSRPKGVVLTHANLEFQTRCLCDAWGWSANDRILHVLPLNHVHGIVNVLLCALREGAVCEMLPRFDAERVWSRLAGGGTTVFMAVPTIYAKLAAAWEAAPDDTRRRWTSGAGSLRLMVSGSAALPVSVLDRWKAMTGQTLLERYGMTEIGMALSNPLEGERRPGTVGQPLPGVEVRVLDEDGGEAVPGRPGEIHVRSAGVFAEYWRRPAETAAAFREAGWFRTGDVGVVEEGYFRILGRLSVDIIKSGGEKVSALEIEETIRQHPAVAECAVVGVPHPEWGEQVCAALVPRPRQSISLGDLRTWAGARLSRHKLPGRLILVDDLPRNALGKVVKARVRELFDAGTRDSGLERDTT
ncbi:MAG: acyl-CoA synthetase [Acidobacteriota bacterium]